VKIIYPESRGRKPRYSKAQEAVIERKLSRYLHLECGHLVAQEDAMLYDFVRHKAGTFFCEKDNAFFPLKPPPAIVNLEYPPY
jgi:hypothetical protein